MVLAALAGAASLSTCEPVPGAKRLWDSPGIRFVMVGETHGTREAPGLFADLICAAARSRPVVVAIEQPSDQQRAIDLFLRSSGNAAARTAFLESSIWRGALRDGRSSEAMLKLFERLRNFKHSGLIRAVLAFQQYDASVPLNEANEGMNRGMADMLEHVAAANPKALVLAYGGSVHMSLSDRFLPIGVASAAARLPREQTRTIFIDGRGSAWDCIGGGHCGSQPASSFTNLCKSDIREVQFPPIADRVPGFDAIACAGKPFTASPPAVPVVSK